MYEELRDESFELVAVAEDTGGEAAAGPFYDAAEATFTTLLDPTHLVSSLYNMTNVPTGVMIDEEGRIVRWDEGAYSRTYQAGDLEYGTDEYVPALRDWVANGEASSVALAPEEVAERYGERSAAEQQADAWFRLGVYFQRRGETELADRAWSEAQRLHPWSWNYHRQDWSFTPETAGRNWFEKVRTLEGRPYYRPMELPPVEEESTGETP